MKFDALIVLLGGKIAGVVKKSGDRLSFTYDEQWRQSAEAYPLSLSMPLTARDHQNKVVSAFMWGLLPDNERTLEAWARRFQVSARNPFSLLAHVGEDCAGAVQFVAPDRLDKLVQDPGLVNWIDERQLAARLTALVADHGAGRTQGDNGQFSLAGAQPKTALIKIGERWGVPAGRVPTTHILKPPSPDFDGMVENEHFCLSLANTLDLRAAHSFVVHADGAVAIAVERYDRAPVDLEAPVPDIVRLHQEDMCQALSVLPWLKYQNDGGPSTVEILDLIRASIGGPMRVSDPIDGYATTDSWAFVDSLIFNWIIGGTDAHAKNYSFLIGDSGLVRLAPLYDVASALGYGHLAVQKLKLAMSISGKFRLQDIVLRHWADWAVHAKLDPDALVARIREMASRVPDGASAIAGLMREAGLTHPITDVLVSKLSARARRVMSS